MKLLIDEHISWRNRHLIQKIIANNEIIKSFNIDKEKIILEIY